MPFMTMVTTSCMGMVLIRFLPVWQWFIYGHGSYKVPTCMAMEWCWDSDWSFSILMRELMAMEG